jgi:hypothetical protein
MLVAGRWFRNIPLATAADKRSEVGQGTCILKLSNGTAHKKERRSRSFAHPVAPRLNAEDRRYCGGFFSPAGGCFFGAGLACCCG